MSWSFASTCSASRPRLPNASFRPYKRLKSPILTKCGGLCRFEAERAARTPILTLDVVGIPSPATSDYRLGQKSGRDQKNFSEKVRDKSPRSAVLISVSAAGIPPPAALTYFCDHLSGLLPDDRGDRHVRSASSAPRWRHFEPSGEKLAFEEARQGRVEALATLETAAKSGPLSTQMKHF